MTKHFSAFYKLTRYSPPGDKCVRQPEWNSGEHTHPGPTVPLKFNHIYIIYESSKSFCSSRPLHHFFQDKFTKDFAIFKKLKIPNPHPALPARFKKIGCITFWNATKRQTERPEAILLKWLVMGIADELHYKNSHYSPSWIETRYLSYWGVITIFPLIKLLFITVY